MKEVIEKLAQQELEKANKKFPLFASPHEGYAVIREELEESVEEVAGVVKYTDLMWKSVRGDNNVATTECVENIRKYALKAVEELIQVIAMTDKYNITFKLPKKE